MSRPRKFRVAQCGYGLFQFDITRVASPGSVAEGQLTRNMRDTAVFGGAVQANERSLSDFDPLAETVRGVRPVHMSRPSG